MEMPESDAGLDFAKKKLVAAMKEQGKDADINSPEIHAKAVELQNYFQKRGAEALARIKARREGGSKF
jgi:hypothetical protein